MFKRETLIRHMIPAIISLVIFIIVGRKVLLTPGIPILAEQIEFYNSENFLKIVYPIWNDKTQQVSLADMPKIYLYGIFYLLSKLNFELSIKLLLLLPNALCFLLAFHSIVSLLSIINNRAVEEKEKYLSGLLAAIIYTFNPWIVHRSRNIILRYQYAFLPLILLIYIKLLSLKSLKDSVKYCLLLSIILSLISTYRFIAKIAPLLSIITIGYCLSSYKKTSFTIMLKDTFSKLLLFCTLFCLISFPTLLLGLLYFREAKYSVTGGFSEAMIEGEHLMNVLSLYFISYAGASFTLPYPSADPYPHLFLLITILGMLYILRMRKTSWLTMSLIVSFVVYLYLSMLKFAPFSFLLISFMRDFPSIGRLYRQAYHNSHVLPFLITFLCSLSIEFLLTKSRKIASSSARILELFLIIYVLSISLASSWPLLTGDLNGYWTPSRVPQDFLDAWRILGNHSDHHTLWMPNYLTHKAIWANSSSPHESKPPMGIFDILSSPTPSYNIEASYFFDCYNPLAPQPFIRPFKGYEGKLWHWLYEPLNIRYLAIHYDVQWLSVEENGGWSNHLIMRIIDDLARTSARLLYKGRYIALLQLNNNPSEFLIRSPAYGLCSLKKWGLIVDMYQDDYPLLFFPEAMLIRKCSVSLSDFPMIISDRLNLTMELTINALLLSPEVLIIAPDAAPRLYSPDVSWAYDLISSSMLQSTLRAMNVEFAFDFDYDKGILFTFAKSSPEISIPFTLKSSRNYLIFIRYFGGFRNSSLGITIDEFKQRIIEAKYLPRKFQWIQVGEFPLSKGKHVLRIKSIRGLNMVNLIAIIPKEDYQQTETTIKTLLKSKNMIYLFDSLDLKRAFDHYIAYFEVFKESRYEILVEPSSNVLYSISVDGVSLSLKRKNGSTLMTSVYLRPGIHVLKLKGGGFRALWILPSNPQGDTTASSVSATILDWCKVSSTEWRVRVNASHPFMLAFAERFDPLWVAEVYKNGKLLSTSHPFMLYAIINGFYITETGELEIRIRYALQEWLDRGLMISLGSVTLALILVILLHLKRGTLSSKNPRFIKALLVSSPLVLILTKKC